jgi:chromate transport protein ChrA
VQRGLAPVAIGLMLSGTYALARLSIFNLAGLAIAAVAFGILSWRRVNPLLVISVGGIAYLVLAAN